jgi:hypothetical protein
MQNGGGRRLIVRGFEDQQAVVVAQGPVDVLDLYTELFCFGLEDRRPLGRMVDIFDALFLSAPTSLLAPCEKPQGAGCLVPQLKKH